MEESHELEKDQPTKKGGLFDKLKTKGAKRKEQQNRRHDINDEFIQHTAVEVTEDNIHYILNRGAFLIARRIWDKEAGKFHDHFVFVKGRYVYGNKT